MKYFKIILVITFLFAGTSAVVAQDAVKGQKIATTEVPTKVKNTLKNYAGYQIEQEATFVKKRGEGTIYAFKMQRKGWNYTLLVNKKGKVIGIRDGERNQ